MKLAATRISMFPTKLLLTVVVPTMAVLSIGIDSIVLLATASEVVLLKVTRDLVEAVPAAQIVHDAAGVHGTNRIGRVPPC